MSALTHDSGATFSARRALLSLLAGLIAVLAFFGATSQAQASEVWTTEGAPLEANAEVGLSGEYFWNSRAGTLKCDVDAQMTMMPAGEGEITDFDFSNCNESGLWSSCTIVTSNVSTPWPTAIENGVVVVNGASWTWQIKGCGTTIPLSMVAEMHLGPDNPLAISYFNVEGILSANGGGLTGSTGGFLESDSPETYGIQ